MRQELVNVKSELEKERSGRINAAKKFLDGNEQVIIVKFLSSACNFFISRTLSQYTKISKRIMYCSDTTRAN